MRQNSKISGAKPQTPLGSSERSSKPSSFIDLLTVHTQNSILSHSHFCSRFARSICALRTFKRVDANSLKDNDNFLEGGAKFAVRQ